MMPAGKYYIGDLCYVMDAEWTEVCSITINGNACLDGEFALADGRRFASYGTMYGDGVYESNIGTQHSVDAGLIGCIRVEDIRDTRYPASKLMQLGAVVDFPGSFETKEENGIIVFGHVQIDTGSEEDDYYEDDYADEDD